MRTISAREIKRRGISAVDEALKDGPVHVIKKDSPCYVIMDQERYSDLIAAEEESYIARFKNSLEDVKAGRVRKVSAPKLIDDLGLED